MIVDTRVTDRVGIILTAPIRIHDSDVRVLVKPTRELHIAAGCAAEMGPKREEYKPHRVYPSICILARCVRSGRRAGQAGAT
jgi:hypothetical protein